jgi:RNA polymerase sporulation-specific sigma factor
MTSDSPEFENISDEDLAELACNGNTYAMEELMQRYKNLVLTKARPYCLASGDPEDLIQEGMIGLYKAILNFDPSKNVKFAAFAPICVLRQIQTAVKTAARQKHLPLNQSISLDSEIFEKSGGGTLLDRLAESASSNPETLFLGREAVFELDKIIRQSLSKMESAVLAGHLSGKSHHQIAQEMGRTTKAVDNALQRVRKKLERSLGE